MTPDPAIAARTVRGILPADGRGWVSMTRDEQVRVLDWLVNTCLLFGCQPMTAFMVAGQFAKGLDRGGFVTTDWLIPDIDFMAGWMGGYLFRMAWVWLEKRRAGGVK